MIRVAGRDEINVWDVQAVGSWQLASVILNVPKAFSKPNLDVKSVITTVKRAMVSFINELADVRCDDDLKISLITLGAGPLSCTSCPTHFMLEGGLCTECLSMQYYDSLTQTCKTCHESCRSCSGPGQYSCVTCAFPLHLDRLNNQCVPCCSTDATPEDQSCCHCDKDTGMYYVCMCVHYH